jgi:hypothetical protein
MSMGLPGWWRRYWFSSAPLLDLAVVRIIAVGTQLVLMLFDPRYSVGELTRIAAIPDAYYHPLPLLQLILLPSGGGPLSLHSLQLIHVASLAVGFLALVGYRTNLSLALFATGCIIVQLWLCSHGDIHHPEAVMMVALTVLALGPVGGALSIDSWIARHWRGAPEIPLLERESEAARWPILVIQWFFALMYISAVYAKLTLGQGHWPNGFTLQYYLAVDGMRWDRPIGVWLSHFHWLVWASQWGVLLFQGSFFLSLLIPRLKWLYVPAGMGLHVGIYVLLGAPFFQWAMLYAVFVPWTALFRWLRHRPTIAAEAEAA